MFSSCSVLALFLLSSCSVLALLCSVLEACINFQKSSQPIVTCFFKINMNDKVKQALWASFGQKNGPKGQKLEIGKLQLYEVEV